VGEESEPIGEGCGATCEDCAAVEDDDDWTPTLENCDSLCEGGNTFEELRPSTEEECESIVDG
jgi:hypothetical protein